MPQTASGNLGLQLGQLLFGGGGDSNAYLKGQLMGSQARSQDASAENAMENARLARAKALIDEDRGQQRLGVSPEAVTAAGYSPEQSALFAAILRANENPNLSQLGALQLPTTGVAMTDARDAFKAGNDALGNRMLALGSGKPLETTSIAGGMAFDKFGAPAQPIVTTPLGEADIALKNAQAVKGSFVDALPLGDGTTQAGFIDPATHTFAPIARGGGLGTLGDAAPTGAPMMDFATLARTTGATMTSGLRSPEHNAQVGGVPNSQHVAGTAADFAVRPEQKPAFVVQATAMGYQAIDEGDHIHLQIPHAGLGSMGGNPGIGVQVGMGGGDAPAPATTMARAPQLAFGQAPAKATDGDMFAKNKAFADQLRASGAISTDEEYKQVLTTGKVQQSDADVHLSPADEQVAQGLASYAVLPSSLGRSKNRGALVARALQINPDYKEAQAKQAYTYLNDLGKSGPTSAGGLVQSMNTLLEHGGVLLNANAALSGTGSQTVNKVKNALTSEFGGTAAPNFNQAVNFYSQELGKLVKGGVANEGEVRDIIRDLDPSRTPEQRSQAILQAMEFVHGRIKAIEDRGMRVLGPMAPDTSLLTRDSQDILSRAYREAGKTPPVMPPPGDNKSYIKSVRSAPAKPDNAAPQPGQIVDGFRFKGGDPGVQANWEAQ